MYLKLENVNKSYGEGSGRQQVLKNVNLEIAQGERAVILGPSGSGKSTLLNLIGGLDYADSGSIMLRDTEVTKLKGKELIAYRRQNLGFVFQFYNLIPTLTLRENVEICALLTKTPLDVDELLATLGLSEHKNKYPSQVSGGQQQRAALARALVKNPDLLLCDEPTGALDSAASQNMLKLLERINERYGTTMLIITHNAAIAEMCHRSIIIKDGEIISNTVNSALTPASKLAL